MRRGIRRCDSTLRDEKVQLVAIDGFALDTYPGTPPTETQDGSDHSTGRAARSSSSPGPKSGHAPLPDALLQYGSQRRSRRAGVPRASRGAQERSAGGYFSDAPIAVGSPLPQNVYTTQLPPPAAKRTAIFSENQKPQFFINGKMFSMKLAADVRRARWNDRRVAYRQRHARDPRLSHPSAPLLGREDQRREGRHIRSGPTASSFRIATRSAIATYRGRSIC